MPPRPETSSSGQPGEVRWRYRVVVGGNATWACAARNDSALALDRPPGADLCATYPAFRDTRMALSRLSRGKPLLGASARHYGCPEELVSAARWTLL